MSDSNVLRVWSSVQDPGDDEKNSSSFLPVTMRHAAVGNVIAFGWHLSPASEFSPPPAPLNNTDARAAMAQPTTSDSATKQIPQKAKAICTSREEA